MIRKETITARFQAGINVGDDPKIVQQELLKCENGYFDRMGAISKRNGFTEIGSGSITEDIITKHGSNVVVMGNNALKVYASDEDVFASLAAGRAQFTSVDVKPMRGEKGNIFLYPTVHKVAGAIILAYTNYKSEDGKYYPTVVTYHEQSGIQLDFQELETGDQSSPVFVRLVNDGVATYAIYCKSTNYLAFHSIDQSSGLISATSTNISAAADVISVRSYDAIWLDDEQRSILIAYPNTSLDVAVKIMRAGTVTSTDTIAATSAYSVGIWRYSHAAGMVMYYDGGTLKLRQVGLSGTLSVTVTDHVIEETILTASIKPLCMVGVREGEATSGKIFVTIYDSTADVDDTYIATYGYNNVTGTTTRVARMGVGCSLVSRPFLCSSEATVIVNYRSKAATGEVPSQSVYFIMDEDGLPRGKYLINRAGPSSLINEADEAVCSNVVTGTSGTDFTVAGLMRTSMELNPWTSTIGETGTLYHDIGAVVVDIDIAQPQVECVEKNDMLLIPNSCPYMFDGQEVVEQGFLTYPEGLRATVTTGGSAFVLGTYGYRATFEWVDAKGNVHVSTASPPVSVEITLETQQVLIYVRPPALTMKTNVKCVLYRTDTNGDIYYRYMVADADMVITGATFTMAVDFTDDDTGSVSGKAMLYTTGNVVNNFQPHGHALQCLHQDRVFYVPSEYKQTRVCYSKHVYPSKGIPHTAAFYVDVPQYGGDITAIASYLGQLVIFKKNNIFLSSGDGYTDDSQGQDYSKPFEISRDIGCDNFKSIAKIDQGIIFKSSREICVLNQTFKVDSKGERVRYLTDNNTIVATVLNQKKRYVVFFTASSAIVYSYLFDQWSTFSNYAATDAVEVDGTVYWHSTGDKVRKESTAFLDVAASITMTIETGWISLADLGGAIMVERVWPIGQNISGHTLNIQTAVDLVPYWDTAQAFNATAFGSAFNYASHYSGLASTYKDKEYITEVRMRQPKCHSVRFKIYDSETAAAAINEGYSLTALGMRVGKRTGPLQVGSGRQV